MGYMDEVDLLLQEQLLLICEHLSEEILVHLRWRRQVVLHCMDVSMQYGWNLLTMLVQVDVEVILGMQFASQLLRHELLVGPL